MDLLEQFPAVPLVDSIEDEEEDDDNLMELLEQFPAVPEMVAPLKRAYALGDVCVSSTTLVAALSVRDKVRKTSVKNLRGHSKRESRARHLRKPYAGPYRSILTGLSRTSPLRESFVLTPARDDFLPSLHGW